MKALKFGVLTALLVSSALVVVASPAFATPRLTSSTGTRPDGGAVTPFLSPAGAVRGTSTDSRFTVGSAIVRCRTSTVDGTIGTTHTQARITAVTFGTGGVAGDCDATLARISGAVRNGDGSAGTATSVDGLASAGNPWFLHVRSIINATSASGTINISRAFSFTTTVIGVGCNFTIPPQSVDGTYTSATRIINIRDASVAFTENTGNFGCPRSGNALFEANYTLNTNVTVRATS